VTRKILKNRRPCITQKFAIGNERVLYLSVDDERAPSEVFIRIKGESGSEKVTAFDIVARLMSLALQEGVPIAAIASCLEGTRSIPAGAVRGDEQIKFCTGTFDLIGRHLLIRYAGREDLAHVKEKT
jgi:ribonucleoside-diphosphate reductase alpha chain